MTARTRLGLMLLAALAAGRSAGAQDVNVGSSLGGVSTGYFEHFGVSFGVQGPGGLFFRMNNPAAPPFGGFQPGAGANLNFAGPNGFLNFSAAQGASGSLSSTSGSLTLQNGVPGSLFAGSVSPFVIGVIPVVSDAPGASPLAERVQRLRSETPRRAATTSRSSPPAKAAPSPPAAHDDFSRRLAQAGASTAGQPSLSVAEIRRQRAAARSAPRD